MFDHTKFSNRENTIILLFQNGCKQCNLSREVLTALGDLPSYSEETELKDEIFNEEDFSNTENILIRLLFANVKLTFLSDLIDVALSEIENGCDITESVRIALTCLNKQVIFSVLELNKILNDIYYAGWNESSISYNSETNTSQEESYSFCRNRDESISNILKNK